ncbi:hypothetical protein Tco_0085236 [Tanacetum coccineum]
MELENSQNNALAKLPMLKLGEYEMWEIRIKQYFQIQDYALWEVIENENSWVPIPVTATETGPSTGLKMTVPSTAEEKICKKNDVKARSLLLMALPNEHQLTFDQYVDAQSMFAAIKARFGGNEATKKTQKALLKQQLAILGVVTPPEDLNVKFLRSLPSEWDTHVVVWMNKPDFDTIGLDDLYNNFKIVEQKHEGRKFYQRTRRRSYIDGSSTVDIIIKVGMFQCHKMDILLENAENQGVKRHTEIRIRGKIQQTGFLMHFLVSDGYKEYLMGLLRTELEKVKEEKEGFEFKIAKPTPLDIIYSGLERFKQLSSVKSPLKVDKDWKEKFFCPANHVREEEPKKARENNGAPIIEDWVSDDEDEGEPIPKVEKKTVIPTATKKEFVKPEKTRLGGSVRLCRDLQSQRLEETKGIGMVKNPIN